MKTQRHEWVTTAKSSFFFFGLPELLKQASWYRERERHTHRDTERVSHSVLELLGGCCFCSFLFLFLVLMKLSNLSLLVSLTRRSKQCRRKLGGSGVGREGKWSEVKRGEEREGKGSVCQSENFWFLQTQRGGFKTPPLSKCICQFFLATVFKL